MVPPRKPSKAVCVGRGGARECTQFSRQGETKESGLCPDDFSARKRANLAFCGECAAFFDGLSAAWENPGGIFMFWDEISGRRTGRTGRGDPRPHQQGRAGHRDQPPRQGQHPRHVKHRRRQGQIADEPVAQDPAVLIGHRPGQAEAHIAVEGQPGGDIAEVHQKHAHQPRRQQLLLPLAHPARGDQPHRPYRQGEKSKGEEHRLLEQPQLGIALLHPGQLPHIPVEKHQQGRRPQQEHRQLAQLPRQEEAGSQENQTAPKQHPALTPQRHRPPPPLHDPAGP